MRSTREVDLIFFVYIVYIFMWSIVAVGLSLATTPGLFVFLGWIGLIVHVLTIFMSNRFWRLRDKVDTRNIAY